MESPTTVPTVLTIAGSDSSGGAGIQADLKTLTAMRVYGASAVTALTAQNTTGVQAVHIPPAGFVTKQIDSVISDLRIDAVKTGMLPTTAIVREVADCLRRLRQQRPEVVVVVDPVLVATSGDALTDERDGDDDVVVDAMRQLLFPIATVVTPNAPEAERLIGVDSIRSQEDVRRACRQLGESGCEWVVLKGGHLLQQNGYEYDDGDVVTDVLFHAPSGTFEAFCGERVRTTDTHGTGCTLATAIAAGLAQGWTVPQATREAKRFVEQGLRARVKVGRGCGPLFHMHSVPPTRRDPPS